MLAPPCLGGHPWPKGTFSRPCPKAMGDWALSKGQHEANAVLKGLVKRHVGKESKGQ